MIDLHKYWHPTFTLLSSQSRPRIVFTSPSLHTQGRALDTFIISKTIRNNYVVLGYPSIFIKIDHATHLMTHKPYILWPCVYQSLHSLAIIFVHCATILWTRPAPGGLGCQLRPPPSTPDICKTVQKWLCCPQLYAEAAAASTWDPGRNRSDLQFSIVYEWVHIRV